MTHHSTPEEPSAPALTNTTLELLSKRRSTRVYAEDPVTPEERSAILRAAMRAPTAGNLMLYSIIEIEDQGLKDRLALTCDNQPFIAKAPWVLVFVADYQKWTDLFEHTGATKLPGVPHRTPGPGDLLLACSDALIAAQNAVIAAESLGIGSCYIGDIIENAEAHQRVLDLPPHTLPITMVCFGRPRTHHAPTRRYGRSVVMRDRYHRLTSVERAAAAQELQHTHCPHGLPPGSESYPEVVYKRKFTAAFSVEMSRSAQWWIDRWCGRM